MEKNTKIFWRLLGKLTGHGEKASYFFWSPSIGFDQSKKPEDQALQIVRVLLRQLLDDSNSRLRYSMEQYPLSELTKAPTYLSRPEYANLFDVVFHSLVATPDSHIYLILDGIDVLGRETSRFLWIFLAIASKLKQLESKAPAVKLFFATRPLNISQPSTDLEHLLDELPSIEKDKELKSVYHILDANLNDS